MATKPTKTKLRNKADKLCGQLARSKGKCEHCGKTTNLQWCHITSRAVIRLRYEERNYFCLCAGCHFFFHENPLVFTKFVGSKKGQDALDWLIRESLKIKPIDIKWYEEVIKDLTKKLEGV